jgi:natural product precursor
MGKDKDNKKTKKLQLKKETIHVLSETDLTKVHGGEIASSHCSTILNSKCTQTP